MVLGRLNPFGDDLSVEQPWRDPHIRFFTRRSIADMLWAAGFRSVVTGGFLGAILTDTPGLWRFGGGHRGGRIYRAFEDLFPALLGLRLSATASK